MENGQLIKETFTSDRSVPWTVIVNPESEVLCTSVGVEGNIGFPYCHRRLQTFYIDGQEFSHTIEGARISRDSHVNSTILPNQ